MATNSKQSFSCSKHDEFFGAMHIAGTYNEERKNTKKNCISLDTQRKETVFCVYDFEFIILSKKGRFFPIEWKRTSFMLFFSFFAIFSTFVETFHPVLSSPKMC